MYTENTLRQQTYDLTTRSALYIYIYIYIYIRFAQQRHEFRNTAARNRCFELKTSATAQLIQGLCSTIFGQGQPEISGAELHVTSYSGCTGSCKACPKVFLV